MKMKYYLTIGLLGLVITTTEAQFKRLLQKAEQSAGNAIDKKLGVNPNQTPGNVPGGGVNSSGGSGSSGSGTGSGGGNTTGSGLVSTPPDVKQNLSDAESAYNAKNFGNARYSVQQAMLGVELEIGNQILKSLPTSVDGLNKVDKSDQVASSGAGWAGLVISRKYDDGKNKQFTFTIANNAAMMSAMNMFMASGAYAQQTGGQQNWKQVQFKGNRAIIQFDKGTGYKLTVPIGQTSLFVFEGVNFATEDEMMTAAGTFDVDGIKKQLGEQ
jgi:hypothetical protein